jgi:hypothetical protein
MQLSGEQLQQCVKAWIVEADPEVDVQVLSPHDDPRERGQIIPIRLGRHGYRVTIGFPERMLEGPELTDATRRTLHQGVRQLLYLEAHGFPRQQPEE